MRLTTVGAGIVACLLAWAPAAAAPCQLNFISHGTMHDSGRCLLFEDDLGNFYEVVNPRGAWRDGMTGTVYSQWETTGTCSSYTPIRVCSFDADYTRNVSGTLVFRNLIECPGYIITTGGGDYLIRNCEDFGQDLCVQGNLGRKIQAEVFVDTGVSICLGLNRSLVLDYRFLK